MHSLLTDLRAATRASHDTLDMAFGSLDLEDRDGYVRFLSGHAIGMRALFEPLRAFAHDLGIECPDYPAMLRADLSQVNVDADALPEVPAPVGLTPEGAGYVLSGSRLGLAMIARNGYWGRDHDVPSAYMEDTQGLAVWKAGAAHLKQAQFSQEDSARHCAAATAAFETFRVAFDASAAVAVH